MAATVSRMYTIAEVAQILRVDPSTVRRFLDRGLIRHVRIPTSGTRALRRVPESSLRRLIDAHTTLEGEL